MNGSDANSSTADPSGQLYDTSGSLNIGARQTTMDQVDGVVDEVRLSNAARSADWIQTEYNNQNDPASFYSLSSEQTAPAQVSGLTATAVPGQIDLTWTAPSDGGDPIVAYKIERRTCSGSWSVLVADTGTTSTSYSDTTVVSSTCYEYRVSAINGVGTGSASTEATATANVSPNADAGPDQAVDEGEIVTLNGSNSSDPDDGIASYLWTQTAGTSVTLSDAAAVQPNFTAPDVGSGGEALTFELTVTDNGGLQSTDTCIVNVTWNNIPPTADAGPDQSKNEGTTVTLNGSNSSDPDDGIGSYLWTQKAGTSVTLSDATSVQPTFTAPDVGPGGGALTFELTVTDNGGLQSTDTCLVNISWINVAPTAGAGPDQTVDEGVTVTLDGSNSSDPDDGIGSYLWTQTAGTSVTLSDATSVQPTFTAPDVGPGGEALTFQLTVTDNGGLQSTDTCLVNISWINAAPTAGAGPDQTVDEGATVTLDGSNSSDPDDGIGSYLWTQTAGTSVTLSDATAVRPTFHAPDVGPGGEALTFQLTVTDSGALQATDTCIVNISWVNVVPTADAGFDQTVGEAVTVTLDGSNSSDPDDGIGSYLWTQTAGTSVTLSDATALQPTFTSPTVGSGGEALTFELTVTDSGGLQATDTCIVNVTSGNIPPTADAGSDQTVDEGTAATLDGSNATDPDDGIASYLWTQKAGTSVTLLDATAVQSTFTAPDVGPGGEALAFELTVTDNGGLKATDTCIVNVSWINVAPTAGAGPDQTVDEGVTVTLDGSNSSDPDDGIASYLWTQTAGNTVTLSNTAAVLPTFTAPNVGPGGEALTFQVIVTDNGGLQATDTCIVNISWINVAPTAGAGPDQTADEGVTVTLDGSKSSDPDDGIASYLWTQTAGTSVTLSDTKAVKPTFTAPTVGSGGQALTFQLTVTDNGGLQAKDTCIVNVSGMNVAPTADAGSDQTVDQGVAVTLDGSKSSDPDDGIASYQWTQTAGTSLTLSDPLAPQPTFTAPTVGSGGQALTFQLTVTDNGGLQGTDTCIVNVTSGNIPPTADAGSDQTVNEGAAVALDGSKSSDPDDGITSYQWRQTAGTSVTLSDTKAVKPTFTAPTVGSGGQALTFQLTVTDDGGLQATDTCIVNVTSGNIPPTADAGSDQTMNEGAAVTLDGSKSSDPDDGIGSYQWTQTAGTTVTLSDATAVQPTFTAPDVGPFGEALTFQLTVTDNGGLQDTDTCIVNISWVNIAPTADAGADQTVDEGITVTLDGSNSSDPDDGIASYLWTQTAGTTVTLSDATAVQPTFTTPDVGIDGVSLTFELTVKDDHGLSATDSVFIDVSDVVMPGNVRPDAPTAVSPVNESTISEGPVTLQASPFSDPDGDRHFETHWLVRRADRVYYCSDYDASFDHVATTGDLIEHTVSGLEPGFKYVWRVGYKDFGSGEMSWSEECSFKVGVIKADESVWIHDGTEVADFEMVSFPQWADDPSAASVCGDEMGESYDNGNFRIGWYDPTAGSGDYVEYGNDLKIEPGRAYWFLARNGLNVTVDGVPVSESHDVEVGLLYNSSNGNGWNMIGCPNNADYLWDDVEVIEYDAKGNIVYGPMAISQLADPNPYIDKRLWRWEDGLYYADTSLMERYGGYWVKANKRGVFLRFPASAQAKVTKPSTMIASVLDEGVRWMKKHVLRTRVAVADSGDTPPPPMRDLNSSREEDSLGVGCFISTAASGSQR